MSSASAPSPDAVLHLAALHTLAQTGFASTSQAASLTLSTTMARYLRLVATTCSERAAQAGRSKVAGIDVVQALEDLGVGGVSDLHEWTVGLEKEVSLTAPGLEGLQAGLRDGRSAEEYIAELRLVDKETFPAEDEESGGEEEAEEKMVVDEASDSAGVKLEKVTPEPIWIRPQSPDFSWLPPKPGLEPEQAASAPVTERAAADQPTHIALAEPLSIIDRYRRRIPFSQSQLSTARSFVDPPRPAQDPAIPPTTTSFPALVRAFEKTQGEPSINLRQTHLRLQATELLRRVIAPPDETIPTDTLVTPIPPPRSTPIVASYRSAESPANLIPLNPDPRGGLLSSLVHHMQSPYLPPDLWDRLTSIRSPLVQNDEQGNPIFYGEPVQGPSAAALARARGKPNEAENADEGLLRYTWDSGPRGKKRWSEPGLPEGRKVVQSGQGELKPRVPAGAKGFVTTEAVGTPGGAPGKIRLRPMSRADGSISPGVQPSPSNPTTPSFTLNLSKEPSLPSPGAQTNGHTAQAVNGSTDSTAEATAKPFKIKLGFKRDGGTPTSSLPGTPLNGPPTPVDAPGSMGPPPRRVSISKVKTPNEAPFQPPKPVLSLKFGKPATAIKEESGTPNGRSQNDQKGYGRNGH